MDPSILSKNLKKSPFFGSLVREKENKIIDFLKVKSIIFHSNYDKKVNFVQFFWKNFDFVWFFYQKYYFFAKKLIFSNALRILFLLKQEKTYLEFSNWNFLHRNFFFFQKLRKKNWLKNHLFWNKFFNKQFVNFHMVIKTKNKILIFSIFGQHIFEISSFPHSN